MAEKIEQAKADSTVDLFRIAKQMKRERQDVIVEKYIKHKKGEIKVNEKEIIEWWKEYFSNF